MALMATPWKHPKTDVYYLRRQIPESLRPAFGGAALHKQSLRTKDPAEARTLFAQANAELERKFEEARQRLRATGVPRPSQRDRAVEMVEAYFQGPERAAGGLDGPERLLLARQEIDRGLWNTTPNGLTSVLPADDEQWVDAGEQRRAVPRPSGHTPSGPGTLARLDLAVERRQLQRGCQIGTGGATSRADRPAPRDDRCRTAGGDRSGGRRISRHRARRGTQGPQEAVDAWTTSPGHAADGPLC